MRKALLVAVALVVGLALPATAQEVECIHGYFQTGEDGDYLLGETTWLESRAVRVALVGSYLNVMFDDNEAHLTSALVPESWPTFSVCTTGDVTWQETSISATTVQLERPWLDSVPAEEPVVEEPVVGEEPEPEALVPFAFDPIDDTFGPK